MNRVRRMVLVTVAILSMSVTSFAQVTAQFPAQTLAALRVKNMQDLSQRVAALATQIGVTPDQVPPIAGLSSASCPNRPKSNKAQKGRRFRHRRHQ